MDPVINHYKSLLHTPGECLSIRPCKEENAASPGAETATDSIALGARGISGPALSPAEFPSHRKETENFIRDTGIMRTVIRGAREGKSGYENILRLRYGFTLDTLPAEGTLFVDPYFLQAPDGSDLIHSRMFPPRSSRRSEPLTVGEQLFGDGRKLALRKYNGRTAVIPSLSKYKTSVARYRAARLKVKGDSGEPIQVRLTLSGGGGKAKRYGAAYTELCRMGIVPASVAGTSAGAIVAAVIACGADPLALERVLKDKRLTGLLDLGGKGAIARGKAAYDFFEEILGSLTGITGRPVTFADLRIPLYVVASKYSDSGDSSLATPQDRRFVFSRETTPGTPVALALRASMAIPAIFSPVEMVDPMTGRTITLVDGGLVENLPLEFGSREVPEVALHPVARGYSSKNRMAFHMPQIPFPGSQLFAHTIFHGMFQGFAVFMGGRQAQREYQSMTEPPEGTFVLNLPAWDLESPSRGDNLLSFTYDPPLDEKLDGQTMQVVSTFLQENLASLAAGRGATSNVKPAPDSLHFRREFELEGRRWIATYNGGGKIALMSEEGERRFLPVKERKIQDWLVEDRAFGDLAAKLGEEAGRRFWWMEEILNLD